MAKSLGPVVIVLLAVCLIWGAVPGVFAGEQHRWIVTLELRGNLVATGELRAIDGTRACESRRDVWIQHRDGGGWETVQTRATRPSGVYRIVLPDEPGDYRALVPRLVLGSGEVCTGDTSAPVKH